MPDYTMCTGERQGADGPTDGPTVCPHRGCCARYLDQPDKHRQAYFTEAPFNKETGQCQYILFIGG